MNPTLIVPSTTQVEAPTDRANRRDPPKRSLTVNEFAQRYHVGPDKVRGWIRRGELTAINVAASQCRKPRFVITPEATAEFELKRNAGPKPKSKPRQRRKEAAVDYFP